MVIATIYAAGNAPKEVQLDSTTGFALSTAMSKAGVSLLSNQEAKVNGVKLSPESKVGTRHNDGEMERVEIMISTMYKGNQVEVLIAAAGNAPVRHVCDHNWTLRMFLESCPENVKSMANLSSGGNGLTFKFNTNDVTMNDVLDSHFKDGLNTLVIAKMYKGNKVQTVEFAFGNIIYIDGVVAAFQTI